MRITANQIEEWGKTRAAQEELPILIRKLIASTNKLTELAMPGGDSVYRTGWDGTVTSTDASPWVPEGRSVWELGCNANIAGKANDDYDKRTKDFDVAFRSSNSFIFVTPRRWHKKEEWVADKCALAEWQAVNVIDADDIETWLESAPSVAIEFAEELGLSGFGVESVSGYWRNWSEQSSPAITHEGIEAERENEKSEFIKLLENKSNLIIVEADSREEAVAFCCSALDNHPLKTTAICVTNEHGWRFVNNPNINICISAAFDSVNPISPREDLTLIQPVCHGDLYNQVEGNGSRIIIPRVKPQEFKQALVNLGEEESDANRLAAATGRSWSVYRRLKAKNPAIRMPYWQEKVEYDCLAVLMLVGAWNASKKGDLAFIEALTNKPYEEVESKLCELLPLDDSPVIKIGNVWKAKSPLELLYVLAPQLSAVLLQRFFSLTKAILTKPDPQLELPEDERYMAAIYGKIRDESGVIIESVNHSLGKLKVFAERSNTSIASEINIGIDSLVRELLHGVDENRWMSLASYLPNLAEASPDVFLGCLEKSLSMPAQPVTSLIKNTTGNGFGNACWYSGLLWSLETIAWNPSKLPRVTNILIELDKVPNDSNWSNSPGSTLHSFYRIYAPQTLATPEQKMETLKQVIKRNEEFSWGFLNSLIPDGMAFSMNNSKPNWRDDDAGSAAENNVYYPHYLSWIGRSILDLAGNRPERIASLLGRYSSFSGEYADELVSLVEKLPEFDDLGKEVILTKLREHISFRKSDDVEEATNNALEKRLEQAYFDNQPEDLQIRYRWLFDNGWVDLPEGERRDYDKTEELRHSYRINAVKHILDVYGLDGIAKFRQNVKDQRLLGQYISKTEIGKSNNELVPFALSLFIDGGSKRNDQFLNGLLSYLAYENLDEILVILEKQFSHLSFSVEQKIAVLACLPYKSAVFEFVKSQGIEVDEHYWNSIHFNYVEPASAEFNFVLQRLIDRNRFRTAFSLIQHELKSVDGRTVYNVLDNLLKVPEDAEQPDSYYLNEAIKYIASCSTCTQRELALLEFGYLPAYGHSEKVPKHLKQELLTNPKMFIELICLVYKQENNGNEADDFKSNKHLAELSWQVLHHGRGVPGKQEDGTIDAAQFSQWIDEVRELGRQCDRATMTDQTIGQWLSACPEEQEGVWPCFPVCELLEQMDAEEIRNWFGMGVRNNRGVSTKSYGEGGNQERKLAAKYKGFADKIRVSYPMTATVLDDIAKSYEYDASAEDDRAQLNYEID